MTYIKHDIFEISLDICIYLLRSKLKKTAYFLYIVLEMSLRTHVVSLFRIYIHARIFLYSCTRDYLCEIILTKRDGEIYKLYIPVIF